MANGSQSVIKVRRVTDIHTNWSDQGEGEHGKFSFQLILDDGAEEAVIRPTADDADVITDLIAAAEPIYFDTEREVLVFSNLAIAAASAGNDSD